MVVNFDKPALSSIIGGLELLFARLNEHFYNGRLHEPVIAVASNAEGMLWLCALPTVRGLMPI